MTHPDAVAKERCERRNRESQVDYLFGDGAFEFHHERFEPLTPDEKAVMISTLDD